MAMGPADTVSRRFALYELRPTNPKRRSALLDDFPVRVFSGDLSATELEQVATSDADLCSVAGASGQEPLGNPTMSADKWRSSP